MRYPWCETHDSPFVAGAGGWLCPWEAIDRSAGREPGCIATAVEVTHLDEPFDLSWTLTMQGGG